MFNDTFTAEIARQHVQDLHREAAARRLARQAVARTKRTKRTPKTRNDFAWSTVQSWHVASAY